MEPPENEFTDQPARYCSRRLLPVFRTVPGFQSLRFRACLQLADGGQKKDGDRVHRLTSRA
jgi:hypothetical protein